MRIVTFVLILLLAMIQYPLWWGHGGWLRVHELQGQLLQQTQRDHRVFILKPLGRRFRFERQIILFAERHIPDDLRGWIDVAAGRDRWKAPLVRTNHRKSVSLWSVRFFHP